MDASPDTPPYDHPLVAGENAAADLLGDLFLRQLGEPAEAHQFRHNFLPSSAAPLGRPRAWPFLGSATNAATIYASLVY